MSFFRIGNIELNLNDINYSPAAYFMSRIDTLSLKLNISNQYKLINKDKAYCPITLENINEGDEYCECTRCNNCFLADSLKTAFTKSAKKCPLCRETWSNLIIYTNQTYKHYNTFTDID
jgi:hypothetical protein